MSDGTPADWPYFARWHYRSHALGFVRKVKLLWHGDAPVGICVFGCPVASLTLRTQYFGLANPRGRVQLTAMNGQLWVLQRVVLHPTYRGAGVAAGFVQSACRLCPVDWIETLTAMGHANPSGFVRAGVIRKPARKPTARPGAYGRPASAPSAAKSRYSEPVYYVFDNRGRAITERPA